MTRRERLSIQTGQISQTDHLHLCSNHRFRFWIARFLLDDVPLQQNGRRHRNQQGDQFGLRQPCRQGGPDSHKLKQVGFASRPKRHRSPWNNLVPPEGEIRLCYQQASRQFVNGSYTFGALSPSSPARSSYLPDCGPLSNT